MYACAGITLIYMPFDTSDTQLYLYLNQLAVARTSKLCNEYFSSIFFLSVKYRINWIKNLVKSEFTLLVRYLSFFLCFGFVRASSCVPYPFVYISFKYTFCLSMKFTKVSPCAFRWQRSIRYENDKSQETV